MNEPAYALAPAAGASASVFLQDRHVWRQRVGGFTALPQLIHQLGGDAQAILAASGLGPEDFADPERSVPFAGLARVLHEAAVRTATPHIGLLAGRAWHLAGGGPVAEMVRHSSTLGEALDAFVAHQHLHSEAGVAFSLVRSGYVDFGYALYRCGVTGIAEHYDATLAAGMNYLRELLGPGWQPTEVLVPHAAPQDSRHFRSLCRIVPRFDSEYFAIRFPEALLAREVAGADREQRRRAAADVEKAARTRVPDTLQNVYRTLRVELLAGTSTGDSVARALGVHRRTLNRRLRDEGTTFQHCLDQVRFDVACQLLTATHVSLDDIAAALGYAGISPFIRTFRRWSGTTPAQWRRDTSPVHPDDHAAHRTPPARAEANG